MEMKKQSVTLMGVLLMLIGLWLSIIPVSACTGITLTSGDGHRLAARTLEWGNGDLNCHYVVVPRGYEQPTLSLTGALGTNFTAEHGYVGLTVMQNEFVVEGINEVGLSGGLFFFPGYGKYPKASPTEPKLEIPDVQLLSFILGTCRTVEDVKNKIMSIRITSMDPKGMSTVHWRFMDQSGLQIVVECIQGEYMFYVNTLGVLTNAPGFDWQLTNLNNYVHMEPGTVPPRKLGHEQIAPFGMGSGLYGIPGDITPPSRFVRATFMQVTAPRKATAMETMLQCFHILNNFDIPIGLEFPMDSVTVDIPSATQFTSVIDVTRLTLYYHTMYNSTIREINLSDINFARIRFRAIPLDMIKEQPIEVVRIK